jgi:hypothetical protein
VLRASPALASARRVLGLTPLDACLAADREEIADLLRERGAERG